MRYIILYITYFLNFYSLIAQEKLSQTIRGQVTDIESQYGLPGASVIILGTDPILGASTDDNGYFEIKKVPIGRHNIKITYIGYKDVTLPNVSVGSAKEVVLDIVMQESLNTLDELVLEAKVEKKRTKNEMITVSARSFSTDESSRFAASVDDPARMALAFAGVSTTDDIMNEIVVRGNSPLGLLWRMNGIEIPSPNHFSEAGASGGGISALSINMLDNSDFLTGAFPAEYGNALSGVFDVKLRNGNTQKREYAMQLGVLGTDVSLEGPFSKNYNGSYLINYRYSTLSLLTDLGVIKDIGDDNIFQDLAYQFHLPTKSMGTFSIFGLHGWSSSTNTPDRDEVKTFPQYNYFDEEFKSDMAVLGLSNKFFFNQKTFLKNTLSYSMQDIGFISEWIRPQDLATFKTEENSFKNHWIRLNSIVNHKINAKTSMRSGVITSLISYDFLGKYYNGDQVTGTYLDENGNTQFVQVFNQWKHRFNEKWTTVFGGHYSHFFLNNNYSIEPRLGVSYNINPLKRVSLGFGLHSKIAPLSVYNATTIDENTGIDTRGNKDLEITKTWHTVLGYDYSINEHLRLKVEAYYQYLYNVLTSPDPNSTFSSVNSNSAIVTSLLSDEGTASNIGMEITLERFLHNDFYYLFTASLFDSKYKMPDGREFNSRYNAGYIFSFLAGKEYHVGQNKKNILGINAKVIWNGGNRYIPIDIESSEDAGETIRFHNLSYANSLPDYYRLDLTASYRKNNPKTAHIISLQIQNVTNRENVENYFYNNSTSSLNETYQFGLIPVLKYRIEF